MVKLVLGMPKWSVVSKWFVAPTYGADIFLRPPFAEGGVEALMVPILSMLLIQIRLFSNLRGTVQLLFLDLTISDWFPFSKLQLVLIEVENLNFEVL